MVNNGPVVGSIDNIPGYKVFMRMDGRPDDPKLSLSLKCNKSMAMTHKFLSNKAGDVESITLCFRPQQRSSRDPEFHMMEQYQFDMLHTVDPKNTTIWRKEVTQSLSDSQIPHIGVFRFYSWGMETNTIPTPAFWQHYYRDSNIHEVFEILFGNPPVCFTIWVSLEHLKDATWTGFAAFDEAFRNRSP